MMVAVFLDGMRWYGTDPQSMYKSALTLSTDPMAPKDPAYRINSSLPW